MKCIHLTAAGLFLFAIISCERHDWEDTKVLHESHDAHGDHDKHSDNGEQDNHEKH